MATAVEPSIQVLADKAAAQSGLPSDFLAALITAEGPPSQLAQTRNPFDITAGWANLTGFGSAITGLWNSVGVGIFQSTDAAISSWVKGIQGFDLYAQFRADAAAGTSVATLATDLAKAGYAGDPSNPGPYVNLVSTIYQQQTGKDPLAPLGQTAPTPTPGPIPGPAQIKPPAPSTVPIVGPAIDAINYAAFGIASGLQNVNLVLVGIVKSVERFFWIVIGLLIVAMGLYILIQAERG